jgi:hypothetical protein
MAFRKDEAVEAGFEKAARYLIPKDRSPKERQGAQRLLR